MTVVRPGEPAGYHRHTLQIKYLRVPDTLLDAVKEEQTRAREAGRSARGSGGGTRGACFPPAYPIMSRLCGF